MKKILLSLCIVATLAVTSIGIYAQSNSDSGSVTAPGSGLQISPTRIPQPPEELTAQPGETVTVDISIRNVTQSPVTATGIVNDFLPSEDESGTPQIILDETVETEYGLRSYIQEVPTVRLEPGEKADLSIEINVPANATPGGHYGVIRYTSNPDSQEDGNVTLSASLGTLVLVEVAGDIYEDASLLELSAAKLNQDTGEYNIGSFFQSGPLAVITRIQNNGNSHVAPFGKVIVRNTVGNVVEQFEMNEARGNVLPDSIRRFESDLENRFYFGRYTVEANLAYGDGGGNIISQQTSFWVIPWQPILIGAVVLVVLIFGGRKALQAYNRRVIRKFRR